MTLIFTIEDTKRIIGGGESEVAPDEWVVAVIKLYYDFVLIFKCLLVCVGCIGACAGCSE